LDMLAQPEQQLSNLARDPETAVADLLRTVRLGSRQKDYRSVRRSLTQLGLLYRWLGRLESALRCYKRLVKSDPTNSVACLSVAECMRALGHCGESLKFVKKGITALRSRQGSYHISYYICFEARLVFEAAICFRLLGDFSSAARRLDRFLRYREGAVSEKERCFARVLLQEARFALGQARPEDLAHAAKAELRTTEKSAIAAAAMAIAAQAKGDVSGGEEWRDKAFTWAMRSVGAPFSQHHWQLTFAILRRLPEVAPPTQEKERRPNKPRN